jgi:hypothetical protein
MTHSPEVRAAHLKALANALRELGPPGAAHVRAAVPDALRRIADAARLEWLPARLLVDLCVAAEEAVGRPALQCWGEAALDATVRAPLARAFYEAALAIDGWNPAVVLSHLTNAWPLLYRGCGDLVVSEKEPGRIRLVHAPVPEILRREATVLPLVGALGAVPSHCGRSGTAVAEWEPASARFVYVVSWT